jgi:hypothetical protein
MRQVRNQKMILSSFFLFLKTLYYFFGVHRRVFNRRIISSCADRGATRPIDMPTLGHHGDAQIVVDQGVVAGGLQEVERNLQGLTIGIPPLKRRKCHYIYRDTLWECLRVLTLY